MAEAAETLGRVQAAERRALKLAQDTEQRKLVIIEEARREAERIIEKARSDAALLKESRLAAAKAELGQEHRRLTSQTAAEIEAVRKEGTQKIGRSAERLVGIFKREVLG